MLHSFILILSPSQLKEGTKRYKNGKIVQQSNTQSLLDYSSNFCSSFFSQKKNIFWPSFFTQNIILAFFGQHKRQQDCYYRTLQNLFSLLLSDRPQNSILYNKTRPTNTQPCCHKTTKNYITMMMELYSRLKI